MIAAARPRTALIKIMLMRYTLLRSMYSKVTFIEFYIQINYVKMSDPEINYVNIAFRCIVLEMSDSCTIQVMIDEVIFKEV